MIDVMACRDPAFTVISFLLYDMLFPPLKTPKSLTINSKAVTISAYIFFKDGIFAKRRIYEAYVLKI